MSRSGAAKYWGAEQKRMRTHRVAQKPGVLAALQSVMDNCFERFINKQFPPCKHHCRHQIIFKRPAHLRFFALPSPVLSVKCVFSWFGKNFIDNVLASQAFSCDRLRSVWKTVAFAHICPQLLKMKTLSNSETVNFTSGLCRRGKQRGKHENNISFI